MEVYELSKPYEWGGEQITKVEMDLESLDAETYEQLVSSYRTLFKNDRNPVPDLDTRFMRMIAEHASGLPATFFKKLSAKDYRGITAVVQNFLL